MRGYYSVVPGIFSVGAAAYVVYFAADELDYNGAFTPSAAQAVLEPGARFAVSSVTIGASAIVPLSGRLNSDQSVVGVRLGVGAAFLTFGDARRQTGDARHLERGNGCRGSVKTR